MDNCQSPIQTVFLKIGNCQLKIRRAPLPKQQSTMVNRQSPIPPQHQSTMVKLPQAIVALRQQSPMDNCQLGQVLK
jgi:hypothetical protein